MAAATAPCVLARTDVAATSTNAPSPLPAGEQNVINIFRRVSPSVVSVANKAVLRDLFDAQLYEVPQGTGSGIVWDREGHILSNFHVIYGASAIQVTLRDGSTYNAEIVGLDPDDDLALLKIAAPGSALVPIEPGRSADLQVGQTAIAIGSPFGLDTSLSVGVVSAVGRSIKSMSDRVIHDVIQTDAAINPGNSGGPLLDSSGRLIGINTSILSPSGAYAGIGFAVPVDTIRKVVPQLVAGGTVQRPALGVRMLPARRLRQNHEHGVAILSIEPGSPAAKAGLHGARQASNGDILMGDILMAIDGTSVDSADDVARILDRHQVGDSVKLVFERDGQRHLATVRLLP